MRGRLVGIMIGLAVVLTPALWDFSGAAAQSDPLPLPTYLSMPTETPDVDFWRGLQPTADPSLVLLPRLSDSLPNPTATSAYESELDAPRTTIQNVGSAIRSVNFGDEDELVAALNDPATQEIYLIPNANKFTFSQSQYLIFAHDIVLYANNAIFEPDSSDWTRPLININSGVSVTIHQINIQNTHYSEEISVPSSYGAAIVNKGDLILESSSFKNNFSRDGGGAIVNQEKLTIHRTIFEDNNSHGGGAIQTDKGGLLTITCSRFARNIAQYGGGILIGSGSSNVDVSYSSFVANDATPGGDDIHSYTNNGGIRVFYNWWNNDGASVVRPNGPVNVVPLLNDNPTIAPYGPNCQPHNSIQLPPITAINLSDYGVEAPNGAQAQNSFLSDSNYKQTIESATGILMIESRVKDWSPDELGALLQGVSDIANAFNAIRPTFTSIDAFRKGMAVNVRGNIRFIRVSGFGICQNVLNAIPRTIVCGDILNGFDKYVTVHELGHTFDNQTGQDGELSITQKINTTRIGSGDTSISDNRGWVMGNYRGGWCDASQTSGYPAGWGRGERGWGSGPGSIYSSNLIDERCQTNNQSNFTNFQKNPPPYIPEINRTLLEIENQETGADMFLNWVYRQLNQGGFKNRSWKPNDVNPDNSQQYCNSIAEGCEADKGSNSGDVRMEWFKFFMEAALNRLIQ